MGRYLYRLLYAALLAVAVALATLPLLIYYFDKALFADRALLFLITNLLGWVFVASIIVWKTRYDRYIKFVAKRFGIQASGTGILPNLLEEAKRTRALLGMNLLERKINTKKQLAGALEHVVASVYDLLNAESAELALFDTESRTYHSSFVVGKPFRSSAQAMLAGALEEKALEPEAEVMIQPVAFAGTILGSLRVALPQGITPSSTDRQILQLLAIQSGVAILNAQYTRELLRMKAASEESIKAKTGFLANLSHELRAPLGIMMNATEILIEGICGAISDEQADTLNMVKTNANHLLELVNDVLDYAKIESGKLTPQKSTILVHEILGDISAVVRKEAEEKEHQFTLVPSQDALAVHVDRRHFRQILINLFTNAIKYTPQGGRIEVWVERIPGNKFRLNVKDSGIGIEASQHHKVFSAFERVENAYALSQIGTGLGMPLTKRLVEVNGGAIDFESQPGKGTHFWVTLDATEPVRDVEAKRERKHTMVNGRGNSILLFQKDDGEREIIAKYLKNAHFEIFLANTKGSAEQILKGSEVKLVIIDNNIIDNPNDDSVDRIREAAKESSLPVILLSSRAFVFDIEKYLRAGIDRCLIKPIDLRELSLTCRELIDGNYHGTVIDTEDIDMLTEKKEENSLAVTSKKLLGIDDILH